MPTREPVVRVAGEQVDARDAEVAALGVGPNVDRGVVRVVLGDIVGLGIVVRVGVGIHVGHAGRRTVPYELVVRVVDRELRRPDHGLISSRHECEQLIRGVVGELGHAGPPGIGEHLDQQLAHDEGRLR